MDEGGGFLVSLRRCDVLLRPVLVPLPPFFPLIPLPLKGSPPLLGPPKLAWVWLLCLYELFRLPGFGEAMTCAFFGRPVRQPGKTKWVCG